MSGPATGMIAVAEALDKLFALVDPLDTESKKE